MSVGIYILVMASLIVIGVGCHIIPRLWVRTLSTHRLILLQATEDFPIWTIIMRLCKYLSGVAGFVITVIFVIQQVGGF